MLVNHHTKSGGVRFYTARVRLLNRLERSSAKNNSITLGNVLMACLYNTANTCPMEEGRHFSAQSVFSTDSGLVYHSF